MSRTLSGGFPDVSQKNSLGERLHFFLDRLQAGHIHRVRLYAEMRQAVGHEREVVASLQKTEHGRALRPLLRPWRGRPRPPPDWRAVPPESAAWGCGCGIGVAFALAAKHRLRLLQRLEGVSGGLNDRRGQRAVIARRVVAKMNCALRKAVFRAVGNHRSGLNPRQRAPPGH